MTSPSRGETCARSLIALALAAGLAGAPARADSGGSRHLARPTFDGPRHGPFVETADDLDRAKAAEDDPAEIRFRNGKRWRPDPGPAPDAGMPFQGTYLLQFPGRVRREWREQIERTGVAIHDYVQGNAFIVTIPAAASEGIRGHLERGLIRHVAPLPAEARVDAALEGPWEGERGVTVVFFREPDAGQWQAIAAHLRVEVRGEPSLPVARGRATAGGVRALAALDAVRWIEPWEPGQLHNIEAVTSGGADLLAVAGPYTGAGVRVAVNDTGIARTDTEDACWWEAFYHPDLPASRIADEWDFVNDDPLACDDNSHGTHVAGTIGGNGTLDGAWAGVAPGATFLVYKEAGPSPFGFSHFAAVLARAAAHDADIVANSWGGAEGTYNQDSYDADRAVRGAFAGSGGQARPMVVSISSGNRNDRSSAPGTAKNAITVGATKDGNSPLTDTLCTATNVCGASHCGCTTSYRSCSDTKQPASERICFSNWGPLDTDGDGHTRIKPDIVAPGVDITSATPAYLPNDGDPWYEPKSGTSMAQPNIAGTAALMLEAYPSLEGAPEMIKARLLATAVSLGDTAQFGHGMVDAYHAIFDSATLGTAAWVGGPVPATGIDDDRYFLVPSGFQEVRVYLTWSDPPSLATEVVDDLDLRVYDAAGVLVASSASYDDTVEFARITSGTPGWWRAGIRGYNVPDPSARMALIAIVASGGPTLSVDGEADPACVRPGAPTTVRSALTSGGPITVASSASLDLPENPSYFALNGVWLETAIPGRRHFYASQEIPHDTTLDLFTLYQGAVLPESPRTATWVVSPTTGAPDGTYNLRLWSAGAGVAFWDTADVAVTVDGTPPADVSGLASYSHTAGTCSNNTAVGTYWNTSSDGGGCGLAGFSVSWSTTYPIMPDTTPELGPDVTVQEWSLSEDTQPLYFNVRSADVAGNGSQSFESWGPIRIDTTPPDGPSGLSSATHAVGSCGAPALVTIDWSAATDGNCGVAGYSLEWSTGAPSLPDEGLDIGLATSHSDSPPASNAAYWFNLRAVDAAGNWAPASSYGPLTLDAVPGEVGGLTLQPSSGDLSFSWDATADADYYRVYRDTDPQFTAPVQVGADSGTTALVETGGMGGADPIVFYRVVGTNVCGLEGP